MTEMIAKGRTMSFSAWKRSLNVGATVLIVNRRFPHLTRVTRVTRTQTNAMATELPEHLAGAHTESWLWYPKASEVEMIDSRTASFPSAGAGRIVVTIMDDAEHTDNELEKR